MKKNKNIRDIEKDFMLDLIRRYAALYFVEILGFCLMGNHLLVRMFPEFKFTNKDIKKRYVEFYGDELVFADGMIPSLRMKLSSLSEFMREIKVGFARYSIEGTTAGDIFGAIALKASLLKTVKL